MFDTPMAPYACTIAMFSSAWYTSPYLLISLKEKVKLHPVVHLTKMGMITYPITSIAKETRSRGSNFEDWPDSTHKHRDAELQLSTPMTHQNNVLKATFQVGSSHYHR